MIFNIVSHNNRPLIERIFQSYASTFPENERRDWANFNDLLRNKQASILEIIENKQSIGYIVIWKILDFTFVEHFEVFEQFRNKNFGTSILTQLKETYKYIILEIEPPSLNDIALRRLNFYLRNKFYIIDNNYIQPSYGEGKEPIPLCLMANFTPINIYEIRSHIYSIVYKNKFSL